MKVTQAIQSLDRNDGGTASYIQLLDTELIKYTPICITTLASANPLPMDKRIEIIACQKSFPYVKGYSKELLKRMKGIQTTLFHGNGMWQFPIHALSSIARQMKIPYILSPHGMLEPWALQTGKFKKKLGLWLYQYEDLAHATCLHATAKSEADTIRALGLKNPIAIIPNGINLSEYSISTHNEKKAQHTLLFLSRIHPIKGIEFLIEAWSKLENSLKQHWIIRIVGNGDQHYMNSLKELINQKGLSKEIFIEGPLFYDDKIKAFKEADLFVLPTFSENFGIVILEALASGVPVITTKGAPWVELEENNAGWWIEIGVDPLVETLKKALKLTNSDRHLMGINGRALAESKYSINAVAKKMMELYYWVEGKMPPPSFIQFE